MPAAAGDNAAVMPCRADTLSAALNEAETIVSTVLNKSLFWQNAASKVYAQKSACSATNLADLAIIYHQLVDKSSDAVTRYDYVLKTIDCYNSAVGKDSNAARARFTEKKVDMDAVAKNYNANLSKFQQAVADSMNF
jgi:hypothetical protein